MHGHGPQPIPVVEFSLVDPSVLLPADVANPQAVPFGFNDGKPWRGGPNADELAALQGVDPAASADKGRYIRYLRKFAALQTGRDLVCADREAAAALQHPAQAPNIYT